MEKAKNQQNMFPDNGNISFCSQKKSIAAILLLSLSLARADNCPPPVSRYDLRSVNGNWSDSEYVLTQRQEWTFVDLDDLPIPIPLPKIQNTKISASTSPTVSAAPTPLPVWQLLAASFYRLQGSDGTCPLLLLVSPDPIQAFAIKFSNLDGAPQSASRIDFASLRLSASSLSSENINRSGSDELVSRSSNGLITAIFSIGTNTQVKYDPLLTIASIWTDFIEKAASNNTQALKYLVPELESEYTPADAFAALGRIKALQKDFDILEAEENFARLAVVITDFGTDYLYYIHMEKRAGSWYIVSL